MPKPIISFGKNFNDMELEIDPEILEEIAMD